MIKSVMLHKCIARTLTCLVGGGYNRTSSPVLSLLLGGAEVDEGVEADVVTL